MSSRAKYQRAIDLLKQCTPETILAAADRCDGHTIFKPEAFLDAGMPHEVVELQTRRHGSDGSPKGTIFVDGQPVDALTGVYGLDLLRFLASALGVEYRSAFGRGTEARHIQAALHLHFAATNPR